MLEIIKNFYYKFISRNKITVDIDKNCKSCLYCSKKNKYCKNEKLYPYFYSNEYLQSKKYTGKKVRLNIERAIEYCNLKEWKLKW